MNCPSGPCTSCNWLDDVGWNITRIELFMIFSKSKVKIRKSKITFHRKNASSAPIKTLSKAELRSIVTCS